ITRPVSYYALFQGWLLLSQPPGCHCDSTSFPTQHTLRGLSRWSGLFPSRLRSLSPAVSLPRSPLPAFGVWLTSVTLSGPSAIQCSTSGKNHATLHPNAFRGEPAITEFDWPFTPTHRSSPRFSTLVGSGLHPVLPELHPAHA